MEQIEKKQKIEQLYQLIASLDSPEDCRALFDDLCTIKEIEIWPSGVMPPGC